MADGSERVGWCVGSAALLGDVPSLRVLLQRQ